MKPIRYTPGDEVIYRRTVWIVMDQVGGMVWISRFGERKQVNAGEIEAVDGD